MFFLRGFITNLGKYNEGSLIGEWIDFPIDDEDLNEVLMRIGVDGDEYEEYFFTDWDTDLDFCFDEYVNIEEVNDFTEELLSLEIKNGGNCKDIFNAILEAYSSDYNCALDVYRSGSYYYYGKQSLNEIAHDLALSKINRLECSESVRQFIIDNFNYRGYENELSHYITNTRYGFIEVF